MNKLTIGFIILIVIALTVFSYYSYKEEFNVSKKNNPCSELKGSQCRDREGCSIISDAKCLLKDENKCSNIDPEATSSSGDLLCGKNGCMVKNNKTVCDGLSSQDCYKLNDKCFKQIEYDINGDTKKVCYHRETENYKADNLSMINVLSGDSENKYGYDCYSDPTEDTQDKFNRYCLKYKYKNEYDSSSFDLNQSKQQSCSTKNPNSDLNLYGDLKTVTRQDIQKYDKNKCINNLNSDNLVQCSCYPIEIDNSDKIYYLPKGLFYGLSKDEARKKVASISCNVLNNIKDYIDSLNKEELKVFNKRDQFNNDGKYPNTLSELINDVIKKKCTIKSCNNICANKVETECKQNNDFCTWISETSECKRKVEAECNSHENNKCSDNDNCIYSTNYSFCGPKIINCKPGQEIIINKDNIAECHDCKKGYFGKDGITCNRCPYTDKNGKLFKPPKTDLQIHYDSNDLRQVSEPKATACVNRDSLCKANEYEPIQLPTGAANLLEYEFGADTMFDLNMFKHKLSNYKNTNRNCQNLKKCKDSQYVTNYHENELFMTSPVSNENITLHYDKYNCKELGKCDPQSEYVSNYQSMEANKLYSGDMYSSNKECDTLTNCDKGEYVKFTTQVKGDQNVSDRSCMDCDTNTYTDNENMKKCIDQPLCKMGEKVKSEFSDVSSDIFSDESSDVFSDVSNEITKQKRLECEKCGDYEYQNIESRNFDCKEQTSCDKGYYFNEDNLESARTYQVQCEQCPCNEYQAESTTFVDSCKQQPIITKPGFGVTDEYPSCDNQDILFKSSSIGIEECDGDINYQDNKGSHRDKCKTHITCGRGELISEQDSTEPRTCLTIPTYELDACDTSRCKKKTKINHRDIDPEYHPICTKNTLLQPFYEGNPKFTPDDFKRYDASCITTSERQLLCAKSESNSCPI